MKWILRFAISAVLVLVLVVLSGMFHLVRTDKGFHLIRKTDWTLETPVIDTRDWNLMDWLENRDIASALGELELDQLEENIAKEWKTFRNRLDKMFREANASIENKNLEADLKKYYDRASRELEEIVDRVNKGSLNQKQFEREVKKIETWLQEQIDKLGT